MNNKIMKITAILIVLLSIALIVLFVGYFLNRRIDDKVTNNNRVSQVSGDKSKVQEAPHESGEKTILSGEVLPDDPLTIIENSGEKVSIPSDETNNENPQDREKEHVENNTSMPNTIIEIVDNNTPEPIISSNTETSNQEKQQVLDEIDSALQGLLEAVGKVPTVDESKLDASLESEVQP